MLDDETPDLGAGYDRTAVDGEAAADAAEDTEVDNTALAEGDDAQVETIADADSETDTTDAEAAE
jgi:hypothetical protein